MPPEVTFGVKKSLSKDKHDAAKLRHGHLVHEGRRLERDLIGYFPFFYTRDGATLALNNLYRGASAFLIAGGPSFRDVAQERLRCVWTMTLNNAAHMFRSNANCTVDEPSRFNMSTWRDPFIMKFVPMAHFEKPLWDNRLLGKNGDVQQKWELSEMKLGECPGVIGYRRNEKLHPPRWLYEETINWGNHGKYGGGRSVLLAAIRILFILGFRRVYLLGVDFDMSPERRYAFPEQRTASAIKGNLATYAKLQRWFAELQPYFLKEGFYVYNCNLQSRLTAFPFLSLDDALAEATSSLGNVGQERTDGMYVPLADRCGGGKGKQPVELVQGSGTDGENEANPLSSR